MSFKDIAYKDRQDFSEYLKYTSLFEVLNSYKPEHKLFESLVKVDEEEICESLYFKYLNLLDESLKLGDKEGLNEYSNYRLYNSDEAYELERRKAIENGNIFNKYYLDKSGKPHDNPETMNNRRANLTELLPCIWFKMFNGNPITLNGRVITNISSGLKGIQIDRPDESLIKNIMLDTLKYVRGNKVTLRPIVAGGNERYNYNIIKYEGDDVDDTSLYLALKQDLLLSLDVNEKIKDYDPLIQTGLESKVVTNDYVFKTNKGEVEKTFINRNPKYLFSVNDLIHNRNKEINEKIIKLTKIVRDKCIQALNIYNYMTLKTFNKENMDSLGTNRLSDITLYWSCSNENKGNFDKDYTDTTSDIIVSSKEGKSFGISLKASGKADNFPVKNYMIQSLMCNMLDFDKTNFNKLVEEILDALWEIQGYKEIVKCKIDKKTFIKYKKRELLDDKSLRYKDICKWNIIFNDYVFKCVMDDAEQYFIDIQKRVNNNNFEFLMKTKLVELFDKRCRYVYNNCYVNVYEEFMNEMCIIYSNFFKKEWNNSLKSKRNIFVNNLFGERPDKNVKIIVGANRFEDTIDATKYNQELIDTLMNGDNCYPIFNYGGYKITISFNGLSRANDIVIKLNEFGGGDNYDEEDDVMYYFATKDYLERHVEREKIPNTNKNKYSYYNNFPYRIFKDIFNYNKPENKSFMTSIKTSIGKLNKVANFPFNSNARVIIDIDKFRKVIRYSEGR